MDINMDADLYAWVTVRGNERRSLIGMRLPDGSEFPMIGHDRAAIEALRGAALAHGQLHGQPVYLMRFSAWSELESYPCSPLTNQ